MRCEVVFKAQPKEEPPELTQHALMESPELVRLALQGQRMAARELVSRHPGCASITAFLGCVLDDGERSRLSGGQFNVLDDAWEAQWAAANRDTVELVDVSRSNLMQGWGQSR